MAYGQIFKEEEEDISTRSRRYDDDDDILEEEEEQEKLLLAAAQVHPRSSNRIGGPKQSAIGTNKNSSNRRWKPRRRVSFDEDEDKELMYDAQEADRRHEVDRKVRSSLSESPSGWNREKMVTTPGRKTSRRTIFFSYTAICALIAALFVAIVYRASRASRRTTTNQLLVSNGTFLFAPTTILISLDGFRADFLQRGLTPALNALVQNGISPRYMTPSFPSVTFPNHFTLVTGLYPESHGVVGNSFWAPEYLETFFYHDRAHSMQPKWWAGEPLWETAELQGVRSAIHMWPGSEAHIGSVEPAYVDVYNGSEVLSAKVYRVLSLLDLPGPEDENYLRGSPRPQLIAAYVPNVDADGHRYGPNSTEIRDTIRNVDNMLASLLEGLKQRNLTEIVNIVVVSDHGMATTSVDRLIQLEDIVDVDLLDHVEGWPHYGLRPKEGVDLQSMYHALNLRAQSMEGFDVYLRDENMPERYHFSNNDRIAPVWIMPHTGWAIVTHDEMDVAEAQKNGDVYHPRGIHGYDNEHPLMRAIFIARGPAFPHAPGSRMEAFQNIEVYNIVCDSLGIEPRPNNGTMRLPLKSVGMHSSNSEEQDIVVDDLPKTQATKPSVMLTPSVTRSRPLSISTSAAMNNSMLDARPTTKNSTQANVMMPIPSRPVVADGNIGNSTAEDEAKAAAQWWSWVEDKYRGFEDWFKGLVDNSAKDNGTLERSG